MQFTNDLLLPTPNINPMTSAPNLTRMSFEEKDEFDVKYEERIQKIRKAAFVVIRQLERLRSIGTMTQGEFDAEVARIAKEELHPYGCDLMVHRTDLGSTRFIIKVQSTGRSYDLIESFFHQSKGTSNNGGISYGAGS